MTLILFSGEAIFHVDGDVNKSKLLRPKVIVCPQLRWRDDREQITTSGLTLLLQQFHNTLLRTYFQQDDLPRATLQLSQLKNPGNLISNRGVCQPPGSPDLCLLDYSV